MYRRGVCSARTGGSDHAAAATTAAFLPRRLFQRDFFEVVSCGMISDTVLVFVEMVSLTNTADGGVIFSDSMRLGMLVSSFSSISDSDSGEEEVGFGCAAISRLDDDEAWDSVLVWNETAVETSRNINWHFGRHFLKKKPTCGVDSAGGKRAGSNSSIVRKTTLIISSPV